MEIQLDLPFTLEDYGGIDAVYVDQAPHHTGCRGYNFFACYTPEGIRRLDGEFCQRILAYKGGKREYRRIRWAILSNPHLHSVIKQNLLYNLEMRRR
jgi:hypothetical protein